MRHVKRTYFGHPPHARLGLTATKVITMNSEFGLTQPCGVIHIGVLESGVLQREALVAALERQPDFHVTLASDLRARPEQHTGNPLDVLLLCVPQCDYAINTAALFEQWHARASSVGIILLVQRCRKPMITGLLRAGLQGHLVHWSTALPFLVQSIRAVRQGQVVLCETTKSALFRRSPTSAYLTEREREVVTLLAGPQHRTRKQVAILLGVSESTVNNHLAHISDKLNVYGLRNILDCCLATGLIPQDSQGSEVGMSDLAPMFTMTEDVQ